MNALKNIIFALKKTAVGECDAKELSSFFALKNTAKNAVGKCDAKELSPSKKEDDAFISRQIDYKNDWLVDSGASCHITGHIKKLHNFSDYKGRVCRSDAELFPITHVGSTVVSLNSNDKLPLQQVYHVPDYYGSCNLISVSQLTSSGYMVLFGPKDVKLYHKLNISDEPIMKGQMLESLYVLSAD